MEDDTRISVDALDNRASSQLAGHRLLFNIVAGILLSLIMVSSTYSFDGYRKGFVLGFGIGPGVCFDLPNRPGANWGIHSDLKLGVGLNDGILFHYTGKQFWHGITEGTRGDVYTVIQPSLGISYYLEPQAPAFFWTTGCGLSAALFIETGLCYFIGAGYEYSSHLNLEFNVIYNVEPGIFNLSLTLNVLGY